MPDSVEYIGDQAFAGCRSLNRINIPSVIEIEDGAFIGCNALESIVRRPGGGFQHSSGAKLASQS